MSEQEDSWLMPTPFGVLHAFSSPQPDPMQQALQGLLASGGSLSLAQWRDALAETADRLLEEARNQNWVQLLKRSVPAPEVRLDDFARHVIAPLSSENCAALASDSGFCLGQAGLSGEEAELLAAACADFSGFAQRQARRGWNGAQRYVSFFSEPQMLLPEWSFVPLWVDGAGYWLILRGEPLLNNLAVVELVWSIRLAASRFGVPE